MIALTFRNGLAICCTAALAAAVLNAPASAQDATKYPTRPLRLIVPFPPSGPNDFLARLVGAKLDEAWGEPVVIDNRPGGATIVGTSLAAKAEPDGYNLLMVSSTTAINQTLQKHLPYNVSQDFTPVIELARSPNILVVNPSSPFKSLTDLIAAAKAQPGKITFGSGGLGTATHLAGEMLSIDANAKMIHVPYKGAGPATNDLLGGQIDWMFGTVEPILSLVKAGKLRALAVSSAQRFPMLADTPTVAETIPGFEAIGFWGIFAPAKTPKPILDKLNAEIDRIIHETGFQRQLSAQGLEVVGGSPQAFADHFANEVTKWGTVIEKAGVQSQ